MSPRHRRSSGRSRPSPLVTENNEQKMKEKIKEEVVETGQHVQALGL